MPWMTRKAVAAIAVGAMIATSVPAISPTLAGPGTFLAVTPPSSFHLATSKGGIASGYQMPKLGQANRQQQFEGCHYCRDRGTWKPPAVGLGDGPLARTPPIPRYFQAPSPYLPPTHYPPHDIRRIAACKAKYRSYDVRTRTYIGLDGARRFC